MDEKKKSKIQTVIIIILVLLLAIGAFWFFNRKEDKEVAVDTTQSTYVEPEKKYDRSKNITMPGWGAFTIPANTKKITQGFEFHNPQENLWYVDVIKVDDKETESLVVDSGLKTNLNHYLKLAGIQSNVKSVGKYDTEAFSIKKNAKGNYKMEAIGVFENQDKSFKVTTKDGKKHTITVSCKPDCYYMTFKLYLTSGDELLYESGLVAPGKYIQEMEMSTSLKKGTYDAYVEIQPYRSDKKTKTNAGRVNITLNVQ